jgi:hypothetical protein
MRMDSPYQCSLSGTVSFRLQGVKCLLLARWRVGSNVFYETFLALASVELRGLLDGTQLKELIGLVIILPVINGGTILLLVFTL